MIPFAQRKRDVSIICVESKEWMKFGGNPFLNIYKDIEH